MIITLNSIADNELNIKKAARNRAAKHNLN